MCGRAGIHSQTSVARLFTISARLRTSTTNGLRKCCCSSARAAASGYNASKHQCQYTKTRVIWQVIATSPCNCELLLAARFVNRLGQSDQTFTKFHRVIAICSISTRLRSRSSHAAHMTLASWTTCFNNKRLAQKLLQQRNA